MADRRNDSSRRPPDNDNLGLTEAQLLEQMKEMRKKSAQSHQAHQSYMRERRDADETLQARMAKNRPPPASGWGSMSNPETTSASDRTNEAAGPAAHNQDSRFEREARSPPSRERREDAERGSREYDERSQWGSRRSGDHPPRTLAMPHTGSDQDDTDQRRPPDFRSRGTPIYDNSGRFVMYDEMWEQANAAAETSAVAAAEAEKAAAETPEEDVNMDTGDDTVPQPAHAVVDR